MASKRRNMFYENKKRETTEIDEQSILKILSDLPISQDLTDCGDIEGQYEEYGLKRTGCIEDRTKVFRTGRIGFLAEPHSAIPWYPPYLPLPIPRTRHGDLKDFGFAISSWSSVPTSCTHHQGVSPLGGFSQKAIYVFLHSEYRSTYRWHEYTGPRQDVVRKPPQPITELGTFFGESLAHSLGLEG
ncbi:hypothetical protein AAG570_013049 [Ranatra chinensis]|uniref:Uncharacterized protein n=1 Tax=Ranatra chinensis TaxID=642074 RepID=A0ABD0YFN8_9HEMI